VTESFPGVAHCRDVTPADWLHDALLPWRGLNQILRIGSFVPAVYPAHARLLHAAYRGDERVRWSEIAAETGRRLYAGTRYNELVGWDLHVDLQKPPKPWREPEPGTMARDQCVELIDALRTRTTTPDDCWFAVWEGYSWTDIDRGGPRVRLENRNCVLFRGPITGATAFGSDYGLFQSPTLWWPDDRAWCVASDLDIYSTYLAATRDTVAALVDHPTLEVFECRPSDSIDPSPNGPRNPDPPGDPVPPGFYAAALYETTVDE
jgi:hypothetical protein